MVHIGGEISQTGGCWSGGSLRSNSTASIRVTLGCLLNLAPQSYL